VSIKVPADIFIVKFDSIWAKVAVSAAGPLNKKANVFGIESGFEPYDSSMRAVLDPMKVSTVF
jgi:hypothetical protein